MYIVDEQGNPINNTNPLPIRAIANGLVAVTPSDTVNLATISKGLYVGGAGNVAVIMADGTTGTFTALTVGIVHPLSVSRVLATGTTATTILALY